ncbi:hypothetical protein Slin14017_G027180 [Septoria linicola]|nr:hypothetical protein Slin14017_G027180 [Septoria linicola]
MGVSPEPCQRPSRVASTSPRRHSQRLEARPERWSGIAQGRANIKEDLAPSAAEAQTTTTPNQSKTAYNSTAASRDPAAMNATDEKAAEAADLQRTTNATPDVFVDAPTHNSTGAPQPDATDIEDPEKDAIRKEIQNKHLSMASSADARKRESIETPPRWSTVLSDSDGASEHTIQAVPDAETDARAPAERSRVTLQVPEGEHEGINSIPTRPTHSRGATVASGVTVASSRRSMPSLRRRETKLMQKKAHPWQHLGITLGLPMVLLFDLVVPCITYYVWYDIHGPEPKYDKGILGGAVACFGFGEIWILAARVWRLFFRQEECAPLLSRSRWELDATSWVYGVAVLLALIPFVIGSELEIPELYLYAPCFIFGFLGLLMFMTTITPFKLPIGINSHKRGTKIRPFIYYAAEDFIAVDGLQDREFRVRYNERYETNAMFRQFFFNLTLFWLFGVMIYIGCASAIIWTLEFNHAFGLIFGILFSWIGLWALITWLWVKWEMKREHRAYEEGEIVG